MKNYIYTHTHTHYICVYILHGLNSLYIVYLYMYGILIHINYIYSTYAHTHIFIVFYVVAESGN